MAGGELTYEVAERVARLTITREQRRNALTWGLVGELRERVADARRDPAVGVVVVTGAGDEAFCAGADLDGMTGDDHVALHEARGELAGLFEDLWALGKPTIARVNGYALAGGFGLALACDFVVAAAGARFGAPEIDVGLWPHMITVPLTRSMPPKKALELMLTGRQVDAEEGRAIGFVNTVVPAADLDAAVDELAAGLAAKSPAVVKLGRDAFYAVWDLAAADALRVLHPMLTVTASTDDAAEGVAAFRERRPPRWRGR